MRRAPLLYLAVGLLFGGTVGLVVGLTVASVRVKDRQAAIADGWKEWVYPGAREVRAMTGNAAYVPGGAAAPEHAHLLTTADGMDQVLGFYTSRLGGLVFEAGKGYIGSAGGGGSTVYVAEGMPPYTHNPTRAVEVQAFGRRTREYNVAIVVSRAAGEAETHILVLYFPTK